MFLLKRYLVSVLTVIAAAALTEAVEPVFQGKAPLIFFLLAALVSAAYGGTGPGLLSTGCSALAMVLFFKPEILVLEVAHSGPVVFATLGVGISLIIGHLQKTNAELRSAKESLEKTNRALTARTESLAQAGHELQRFAYALAHDLAGPLRGIATLTELLLKDNVNPTHESSRQMGSMIASSVRRVQSMVDGLLEYVAAAEKPQTTARIDCSALVDRILKDSGVAIKDCGAQVIVDPLPSIPGTGGQLDQVFSNLIGNAIKYRHRDRKLQIHISATEREIDWVFCVRDNGIGIDMQYADEIFGMFKRLHHEGEYEGSGIGLALCKIVIQRHGGEIWIESELGKESSFFFTLPKTPGSPRENETGNSRRQT